MVNLSMHSVISKSSVSSKEKYLEAETDYILKAAASVLSSGQGHKWGVRNGLESKQQMLLMPTALQWHAHFSSCAQLWFSLMYREE